MTVIYLDNQVGVQLEATTAVSQPNTPIVQSFPLNSFHELKSRSG